MSILCSIFGHQPPVYKRPGWYSPGEQYAIVEDGGRDGSGRWHLRIRSDCARCGEAFEVALGHVPTSIIKRIREETYARAEDHMDDEREELRGQIESWKSNARDVSEDLGGALNTLAKLYVGTWPGMPGWEQWDDRYVRAAMRRPETSDWLAEAFRNATRGPVERKVEGPREGESVRATPSYTAGEKIEAGDILTVGSDGRLYRFPIGDRDDEEKRDDE